jgi:hypothetical protein
MKIKMKVHVTIHHKEKNITAMLAMFSAIPSFSMSSGLIGRGKQTLPETI